MGDTDYDLYDTPFDIKDNSELEGLQCHEAEGELATPQLVSLLARSLTVLLCVGGGAALAATIRSRGRGSLAEAGLVMAIQIVWQVLAWYMRHVDANFVFHFSCGTVDSETSKKVYAYFEHLLHALAVYSGVVVVARLASLVGTLLHLLAATSILAPLVYSVTVLLLDLYIDPSLRSGDPATLLGVAAFKLLMLDLVPLGLLLVWSITQCSQGRGRQSSREVASWVIAGVLVLHHLAATAQFVVYTMEKTTTDLAFQLQLVNIDLGLTEAAYLLACLALPWAWLVGLLLPRPRHASHQLDTNLKLAKQNKQRNIIKYEKERPKVTSVATPPTSPVKFSPEVTSSPSVHSLALSRPPSASSNMNPSAVSATPLTEVSTKPEKRRSYLEAVSSTNLAVLEDVATPRQAKSADPLWLPSGKPIQL